MKVFLIINRDFIYMYSYDLISISKYINKPIIKNYILLHYNELSEYNKKLNNKGYICKIIKKSCL